MPESYMTLRLELEREEDGRWIAEVLELPGVMTYGDSREQAAAKVQALALRVLAGRLEHGEMSAELVKLVRSANTRPVAV
jgi:predicted RNase H-like HicB family nuclease